jgi:hypothetical protein
MQKTITLLAALALALSCGKTPDTPQPTPEPKPDPSPVVQKLPINIGLGPISKATDTAYENGDVVGVWVVNNGSTLSNSGNNADNVAFSYDGSSWKSAMQLYWKDETTSASFYAYFPRVETVADVKAVPFSVKTNQSTLAGYKASALIWGNKLNVAPTTSTVEIITYHRMSNLQVFVLPGDGYTEESMKAEGITVAINNLKVSASLNLETGEVTATGAASDITPYLNGDHYQALVPPQSLQDQTLVSLTVGDYSFTLKETITLKSNTQHKVTLTVNKMSEGINIGIGQWETDDIDYGGTVN